VNPDLVKALRQLLHARKTIADLSPAEEEAFIREETKGKHGLDDANALLEQIDAGANYSSENFGRSVTQGALFNMGDEIVGGKKGAKELYRLKDERFREKHPYASGAANIAGAVGSGIATGGVLPTVAVGSRVASAAANGAIGGGVYGALSGAGEGEGLAGRAIGAATGGGMGAVVGGALGGIVGKAINTFNPAARGDRRLTNVIKKSGGAGAVRAQIADANRAGVGKDIIFGDVTPHATKALRFGTNNNVDVEVAAEQLLYPRRAGTSERLLSKINKAVGPVNLPKLKQTLHDTHQTWADGPEGYGGLRGADLTVNPAEMSPHLAKPTMPQAWQRARLSGDLKEGEPLDNMIQQILQQNPGADPAAIGSGIKAGLFGKEAQVAGSQSRPITFADMQSLKRALDGKIARAFDAGDVNLAQSYKEIRDGVRSVMLERWPGYRGVDSKYEAFMRVEEAVRNGEKSLEAASSDDLAMEVAKLRAMDRERPGFGFLESYRKGVQGALQDRLNNVKTNRNVASDIIEGGPTMKAKLKVIFGNDGTYNWFMNTAKWELRMNRTTNVVSGSQTHKLGAEAHGDPAGDLTATKLMTPYGVKHWLGEHTFGPSIEKANAQAASHVGRSLLTQGSPAIEAEVERLLNPSPLLNAGLRGVLSGGSGASGGLMSR
jgi:hypothetical protein